MKQPNSQIKKIGLALGGGFIRGSAEIGVIEVLEENNIPIDMIAGCSSGSVVAAAYAAGTMPRLKKRLSEGSKKDYRAVIIEPTIPRKGFLKGERNRKFFEEFVGDKNFSDLNKQLFLAATDMRTGKEAIIKEGKLGPALQACTAVPGIFVPVEIDDKILVDGGNFNLIPSKVLYQNGADYVIAVFASQRPSLATRFLANFVRLRTAKQKKCIGEKCYPQSKSLNIFQLVYRSMSLSVLQIQNFYHTSYPYNVLLRPAVEHIKRWHVAEVDYCIEEGRKAALAALPQIKKDLGL